MSQTEAGITGGAADAAPPVLAATGISKTFGATRALRDVGLTVARGEVHCLVGENGSGKSTLVKIISGVQTADAGQIRGLGDVDVPATRMSPAMAQRIGIHVVHQEGAVFEPLTVAENLMLGRRVPQRWGRIDWRKIHRHARTVLDRYEVPARAEDPVRRLSPAVRSMVAIARALQDCRPDESGLLVLDEPTAALSEHEVEVLLRAVRAYAAAGQSILLVTHRLEEVLGIAGRISVLRDGELIASRPRAGLERPELIRLIVGTAVAEERVVEPEVPVGLGHEPVLETMQLQTSLLHGLDLRIEPGEIVGVTGILGSGVDELIEVAAGLRAPLGGSVRMVGRLDLGGVGALLEAGVVLVPRDRAADGAFAPLSVGENLSMGVVGRYWRRGLLSRRSERAAAAELIERFSIRPDDHRATMSTLSGGNQQKVVLARALQRDPKLVLLHEPTQGVDVGARAQIHARLREAAAERAGVLLVTTDLDELLLLSHRIAVIAAGHLIALRPARDFDRQEVVSLMHQQPPAEPMPTRPSEVTA